MMMMMTGLMVNKLFAIRPLYFVYHHSNFEAYAAVPDV